MLKRTLSRVGKPVPPEPVEAPKRTTLYGAIVRALETASTPVTSVAVLPGATPTDVTEWLHELVPGASVTEFGPDLTPAELHVQMAAAGWFDLIVDTSTGRGRYERAHELVMRLRAGGVLVVRLLPRKIRVKEGGAARRRAVADRRALAALFGGVGHAAVARLYAESGNNVNDAERLGLVVDQPFLHAGHFIVKNRAEVLAKIREEEVGGLLDLRGRDFGSVLHVIPGLLFESRAKVHESVPDPMAPLNASYDVPDMALRVYHDALCVPGQIVAKDNVLLPDTFRHNQSARNGNRYLVEVGPRFAMLPETTEPVALAGSYFYLDSEFRGHFGHAVTEVISRLWAWDRAKQIAPDLKALMCMNKYRHLAQYEVDLFGAAGIPAEDIVFSYEPVRVESLYAATPMFSQPAYVHPEIETTWRRIGDALVTGVALEPDTPRRIFVSRRLSKRPCHNGQEVEALFEEHGFTIVFPEDSPLGAQVALFRSAEVIAGFSGSGLFNVTFASEPKHLIMVGSESYTARNEHMIAAVLGHRVDIATCRSDNERTVTGHWKPGSFHAGFTYEPDSPGGMHLRAVLAALDHPARDGSTTP